jgi:hypothetical protein
MISKRHLIDRLKENAGTDRMASWCVDQLEVKNAHAALLRIQNEVRAGANLWGRLEDIGMIPAALHGEHPVLDMSVPFFRHYSALERALDGRLSAIQSTLREDKKAELGPLLQQCGVLPPTWWDDWARKQADLCSKLSELGVQRGLTDVGAVIAAVATVGRINHAVDAIKLKKWRAPSTSEAAVCPTPRPRGRPKGARQLLGELFDTTPVTVLDVVEVVVPIIECDCVAKISPKKDELIYTAARDAVVFSTLTGSLAAGSADRRYRSAEREIRKFLQRRRQ